MTFLRDNTDKRLIACPNCHKKQPDRGRRATCIECGCSPLPSYSYDKDGGFYPKEVESIK